MYSWLLLFNPFLRIFVLTDTLRLLMFKVIRVELISTIFFTVFYLLLLFFVPRFCLLLFFCLLWFSLHILCNSIFSPFLTYQMNKLFFLEIYPFKIIVKFIHTKLLIKSIFGISREYV